MKRHLRSGIDPSCDNDLFLADHAKEFERLKRLGVDNRLLDFGMEGQQTIERAQYLPPELIASMSRFQMGSVFSTVKIPSG